MPNLSFYEKQHIQRLIEQEGSLKLIFDLFTRRIGKIMERWSDSGSGDVWARNAAIEKEVDKELEDLRSRLIKNINDFSIDAWSRSNLKTDDLITGYVKDLPINKTLLDGLFARRNEAFKAFQTRKMDNLTISDRVWKATGSAKENIEYYLQSGLSTGRSANLISQDIRQLLLNPDRRFHRIRNDEGKLIPSAPMKAYHPGQGVYRSSYMNAKRLAATETNMAYRTADSERWSKIDFILGIEIKRSASAKGPCPICDALVGRYPKDYKFASWHPWCICVATPILMNEDDFVKYLSDGNLPESDFVQDIPVDARAYMEDKLDSGKLSKDSYLFKDNKSFFDGTRGNVAEISKKLGLIQNMKPDSGAAMVSFVPYSDLIIKKLQSLATNTEKQKLFKEIMSDDSFKVLYEGDKKAGKTLLHPLHRGLKSKYWPETKRMAKELNKAGIDVVFLPEQKAISSADAITQFNKKYVIVDFKYSGSTNAHTLYKDLEKGFSQSQTIVLKLNNGDLGTFRDAIEELKRKGINPGNIKLINSLGKTIDVSQKDFNGQKYLKLLRGFL